MLSEETNMFGLLLGVLVSLLIIVATFVLNRKLSLVLFTFATGVAVFQFGFVLDLVWLAVLNFLLMLRNISFNIEKLARYRKLLIIPWLIVIYSVYVTVLINTEGFNFVTVLPLFAILLQTVGLAQTNMLLMKILITLNETIWLTVLILSSLWGNVIGSVFVIASGLTAISRIVLKNFR